MSSSVATVSLCKFIQRFSLMSRVNNNLMSKASLIVGQPSKYFYQFSVNKSSYISAITLTNKIKSMRNISTTIEPTKEELHAPPLTKGTAHSLVLRLTSEERTTLLTTLQQFESEQIKAQYKGKY